MENFLGNLNLKKNSTLGDPMCVIAVIAQQQHVSFEWGKMGVAEGFLPKTGGGSGGKT